MYSRADTFLSVSSLSAQEDESMLRTYTLTRMLTNLRLADLAVDLCCAVVRRKSASLRLVSMCISK
jgi:hypothetical protein